MQDEARVRGQPAPDRRRLVSGGVVEDQVDGEFGRDLAVERLEELFELDRAVAGVQAAPITLPVVMSSAAYRLEVPERL